MYAESSLRCPSVTLLITNSLQHNVQGSGNRDEAELMGDWFGMVHEKNGLVRWAQELAVRARELELEDRHVRLQHELKHRMALPGGSVVNFVS